MVERRQFSLRRRCRLALQAALGYTFWLSAVAVFFKARLGRSGRATPGATTGCVASVATNWTTD
jgi:hypothetical protein